MKRQINLEEYKMKAGQRVSRRRLRRRSRIVVFLAFPFVVFVWFIGWSLYWIGYKENVVKSEKVLDHEELVSAVTIPEVEFARQNRRS